MSEHKIQNIIRNGLAGKCLLFRANVGSGWTSSKPAFIAKQTQGTVLQPGDVVLRAARPFSTGLPVGFSDTFGLVPVTITPDMVGQLVGIFVAGEVKDETGRLAPKQADFLAAITRNGGRAAVWRTLGDALATVEGQRP
jgi:hypothetical protein